MKNKYVAIILTFFVGGFGFHKFYLGEKVAGILYLLFSWTFIPSILAIFDFIGLLLISETNFNAQYNLKSAAPTYRLTSAQDNISNLKQLKELYELGIITAEEYEQKRRKFLDLL